MIVTAKEGTFLCVCPWVNAALYDPGWLREVSGENYVLAGCENFRTPCIYLSSVLVPQVLEAEWVRKLGIDFCFIPTDMKEMEVISFAEGQ